jgi:hypothetical protein
MYERPINALPEVCASCGFPDIEYVPQPYLIRRTAAISGNELAMAEQGNFFVRERARRILEVVADSACRFFPTCYLKDNTVTPWQLAVPAYKVTSGKVKQSIPTCSKCGQPLSSHPGSQYDFCHQKVDMPYEIAKSANWISLGENDREGMGRELFFSVRLYTLLKKLKVKGLFEAQAYGELPSKPSQSDQEWIEQQSAVIQSLGIPLHSVGTVPKEDSKWLKEFISQHLSINAPSPSDVAKSERRNRVHLPKSYTDFITGTGPCTFAQIDGQEKSRIHILPLGQLDYSNFRLGQVESPDDDEPKIDGVAFAANDFGDYYCFDVKKGANEYEIFFYNHECMFFESAALDFASWLRAIAGNSKMMNT